MIKDVIMEANSRHIYPIGIQTFSKIRDGGYLYVDKTGYLYQLTHMDSSYLFLSRPRRFGKSLLVSTLQCYFEGRRELFEGLEIENLEKKWLQHPVLHFDMSTAKHCDKQELLLELEGKLSQYEELYGRGKSEVKVNQRLEGIVKRAYEQTGQKVVVLIDEYDAPLLDVVHEKEGFLSLREVMRNFYSPLKACDPYLRFVFITGITKFSQLSLFSELNNITNISLLPRFAGVCGITKEELAGQMDDDVRVLADNLGIDKTQMFEKLAEYYDGYHFSWPSSDVFNPYSLLKAMALQQIKPYWFESGTPTYVVELLRQYGVFPSEIGGREVAENDFNVPVELGTNYLPLLYQSGYLTIKNGDLLFGAYTLDIPNKEVRLGLMSALIPYYVTPDTLPANTVVRDLARSIYQDDMDAALHLLQTFLATVPYCANTDYEGHYQQMFYIIFSLLGAYVDVEVRTLKGRIDMVIRSPRCLYLVELKLNGDAVSAIGQIDLKQYADRFALSGLPVTKVGINFSSEKRNVDGWCIV